MDRCGDRMLARTTLDERLTQLVLASSSLTRSDGPEGIKPFIPKWQQTRLLSLLTSADIETKRAIASLFDGLESNQLVAIGLVLRAIGARIPAIHAGKDPRALLGDFLAEVRGKDEELLRRRATVLDLDSRSSVSTFDIRLLSEHRGVIYEPDFDTGWKDNDGLFQRFTAACGPTVLQMMIAEVDPVLAFEIHGAGLFSDAVNDPPARFQKKLLEHYGGVAIGRREAQLRARVRNALGRLARLDAHDEGALDAFREMVEERGPATDDAKLVLAAMRERFDGFPNADELARLRRAAPIPDRDEGIDATGFADALGRYVTPVSGVVYEMLGNPEGIARGQTWRYVDRIVRTLRMGIDVPIGIAEPSHWLLITATKGRRPYRQLLVSDPEGGRTTWVRERDLVKGTFIRDQLFLCASDERGYVDCIFVDA